MRLMKDQGFLCCPTPGADRKCKGLFNGIDNYSYYSKRRFCDVGGSFER